MIADKLADYLGRFSNGRISFSQSGEDLICSSWLNSPSGFYIDIGCNHPIRLNNTFHFYQRGWTGISIDSNPDAILLCNQIRPKDLNLNLAISNKNQIAQYYIFNPNTLSTFSKKQKDLYIKSGCQLLEEKQIKCITLKEIWSTYVKNKKVDILNIDVEGHDEAVILGNNWNTNRPRLVIVETTQHNPIVKGTKNFDSYFKRNHYHKFADTFINTIYASHEFIQEFNISLSEL